MHINWGFQRKGWIVIVLEVFCIDYIYVLFIFWGGIIVGVGFAIGGVVLEALGFVYDAISNIFCFVVCFRKLIITRPWNIVLILIYLNTMLRFFQWVFESLNSILSFSVLFRANIHLTRYSTGIINKSLFCRVEELIFFILHFFMHETIFKMITSRAQIFST